MDTKEIEKILSQAYQKSNLKWLKERTIYITLHGSHAYGTNIETSDMDFRGIVIPPKEYIYGFAENGFEQAEFKDPDFTLFDIRKFVKLAMAFNPNAVEILFTDPSSYIFSSDHMLPLLEIRDKFISKRVKYTMSGYAASQLNRIKLHRRYILNPPKAPPERKEFGLPDNRTLLPENQMQEIEAEVQKKLDEWNFTYEGIDPALLLDIKNKMHDVLIELKINTDDYHIYAARHLGLNDNLLEAFRKERQYRTAKKEWQHYQEWQKNRNKVRYEMERRFHYDLKFGLHLVRLLKMCLEVLETGKLIVKRPDAEELIAIRQGAWSFDELIEWSDKQSQLIEEAFLTTELPYEPDRKAINQTCIQIVERMLSSD